MKTVYTAVADPGQGPRGPSPLLSQGLDERRLPPPPQPSLLYLRVCIRHCSAPESGTETSIRYVAIHFQDQRDAAWLRYRTCAEITV